MIPNARSRRYAPQEKAERYLFVEVTSISATTENVGELVRRARAGDTSAFEALYRAEVGRVYALCLRMTNDEVRADVLTQDTFVKAWKNLHQFRQDAAFSTWLYRIAVNVVLMAERTNKRRRERHSQISDAVDIVSAEQPSRCDAALDVEEAIRRLPPQAKAVVILHEIEGYTHEEIGGMLGVATGTSRAHLHRARSLLRDMLRG